MSQGVCYTGGEIVNILHLTLHTAHFIFHMVHLILADPAQQCPFATVHIPPGGGPHLLLLWLQTCRAELQQSAAV